MLFVCCCVFCFLCHLPPIWLIVEF
jgi:hypothetical protein